MGILCHLAAVLRRQQHRLFNGTDNLEETLINVALERAFFQTSAERSFAIIGSAACRESKKGINNAAMAMLIFRAKPGQHLLH